MEREKNTGQDDDAADQGDDGRWRGAVVVEPELQAERDRARTTAATTGNSLLPCCLWAVVCDAITLPHVSSATVKTKAPADKPSGINKTQKTSFPPCNLSPKCPNQRGSRMVGKNPRAPTTKAQSQASVMVIVMGGGPGLVRVAPAKM